MSNAIVSETKDFIWIFYCIPEVRIKKKMTILA